MTWESNRQVPFSGPFTERLEDSCARWGWSALTRLSPRAAVGLGTLRRESDLRKTGSPRRPVVLVQMAARIRVKLATVAGG